MHEPEKYEDLRIAQGRHLAAQVLLPPIFEKLSLGTKRNQRILDFGCGTGKFAETHLLPFANSTDSNIVGLDISKEMIATATSNYSHYDRIKFICEDIMSNSCTRIGEFDQIISFFVLHFIKDYKGLLQKFYKILKPGGQCGFVVSANHDQFHSYKLLGTDPKWSKYMEGYENSCPVWTYCDNPAEACKTGYQKAAEEVGFKILELSIKKMEYTAQSLNLFADYILTLNPCMDKIPKELHLDLHKSQLSHMCKFHGVPNTEEFHAKPFPNTYEALLIALEKPLEI